MLFPEPFSGRKSMSASIPDPFMVYSVVCWNKGVHFFQQENRPKIFPFCTKSSHVFRRLPLAWTISLEWVSTLPSATGTAAALIHVPPPGCAATGNGFLKAVCIAGAIRPLPIQAPWCALCVSRRKDKGYPEYMAGSRSVFPQVPLCVFCLMRRSSGTP